MLHHVGTTEPFLTRPPSLEPTLDSHLRAGFPPPLILSCLEPSASLTSKALSLPPPPTPFYKDHPVELPPADHPPINLVIFALMVRVGGRGLSHITQLLSLLAGESGACRCHSFFFFFPGWGSFRGIWKETSGNNIPELEGIPTLLVASEDAAGVGRQQSRMTRRINCGGRLTFPPLLTTPSSSQKNPQIHLEERQCSRKAPGGCFMALPCEDTISFHFSSFPSHPCPICKAL